MNWKSLLIPIFSLFCFCILTESPVYGHPKNTAIDNPVEGELGLKLKNMLLPDLNGVIRGINFNMNLEEIKLHEVKTELLFESDKQVAYTVILDRANEEFADIYYNFNEEGLFEISYETFQKSSASVNDLIAVLSQHFNETYGEASDKQKSLMAWSVTDDEGFLLFEIVMEDISTNDDAGLSLEFFLADGSDRM